MNAELEKLRAEQAKNEHLINNINLLLFLENRSVPVFENLQRLNVASIAVYGMGTFGQLWLLYCRKHSIQVKYCIDRNTNIILADQKVVPLTAVSNDVDLITVASDNYFSDIKKDIDRHFHGVGPRVVQLSGLLKNVLAMPQVL